MTRLRLTAIMLVVADMSSLTVALPASAVNYTASIQNRGNSLCLQPENESISDQALIVQMPCNNSVAQTWSFEDLGSGIFRTRNLKSGLCLDVIGKSATNGLPVVQGSCVNITNEKWQPNHSLPSIVTLRSRIAGTSSHCLDVPGGQSTQGLAMQIYVCNGTPAQTWGVGVGTVIIEG